MAVDDDVAGLVGALGGLADRGGDLVERGGGLFQAGGLLLGAARQVVGGLADLAGAGADARVVGRDHLHGVLQLRHGGVEVVAQLFVVGGERLVEAEGQVAGGQVFQAGGQRIDHLRLLASGFGLGRFVTRPFGFGDNALFFSLALQTLTFASVKRGLPEHH